MIKTLCARALLALLLCAIPTASIAEVDVVARGIGAKARAKTVFIADPGVSGGGVSDDSAYLNNLIATYGSVYLPCGTYRLKSSLLLFDDSSVEGSGACTVIKTDPALAANPMWGSIVGGSSFARIPISNASAAGNSNIRLSNFKLDVSAGFAAGGHAIGFYKVSNVVVSNITFIGSGGPTTFDATAFVNSRDYKIIDNYAAGFKNACYDNWDAAQSAIISRNTCYGNSFVSWGILMNGLKGSAPWVATAKNITITDNQIFDTLGPGIDVRGLCFETTCGLVQDAVVNNNIITNSGNHCVWFGEFLRVSATGNIISGCQYSGVYIASQISGGSSSDIKLTGNTIHDVSLAAPGVYSAIHVGNGSDTVNNPVFVANDVIGTTHQYAMRIRAASQQARIWTGKMAAGTAGVIVDGGAGTMIDGAGQTRTITGDATMNEQDTNIIANCATTCTLTLLDAQKYPNRTFCIKNISTTGGVVSASINIKTLASNSGTTTILAATQGKWACLKSEGANSTFWTTERAN